MTNFRIAAFMNNFWGIREGVDAHDLRAHFVEMFNNTIWPFPENN